MKKSSFSIIFGVFLAWLVIFSAFFVWQKTLLPVNEQNQGKISFVISKGAGISEIGEQLKLQGLIKDETSFKILIYFLGISKKIQAGTFSLSPSMGAKEIAVTLTKGTNDQWVTIVEGLRQEQIGQLLVKEGFPIDQNTWVKIIKDGQLEGKLFPDSYLFPNKADIGTILKIINKNFEKKVLLNLNSQMKSSDLSLEQIITLASLLEREVRNDNDRKTVAGILLKRLENDWPLQIDATVQYALSSQNTLRNTQNFDWWSKNLSATDLKIKSSYNTYVYKGLPPGPICNPGLSSIQAILNPQESEYWFYLSDPNGITHFAKTSEEHAQNIQKYLH